MPGLAPTSHGGSGRRRCRHHLYPIYLVMLLIILLAFALMVSACGGGGKPPAGGAVTPPPPPDPSRPALTAAATALEKKDVQAFSLTLSEPLREAVAEHLDLSGPGAATLAKALKDARLVGEYEQVRVYETTIDGETYSFMAVKEGDQWLLTGL
jgi:hypothetical protein